MIINDCFKIRSLILSTTLVISLGFVTPATAEEVDFRRAYLVDLNTRTATPIGFSDEHSSYVGGINNTGQVVGWSDTAEGSHNAFITAANGMGIKDFSNLGSRSEANAINDAGRAVGFFEKGVRRAFIADQDGVGVSPLGTLGGPYSQASGINEAGQVVGWSNVAEGIYPNDVYNHESPNPPSHAFITGANGVGMRDLGTLGGRFSYAYDINEIGQVAGTSYTVDQDPYSPHAFITAPNGIGMRDLGTLGGRYSQAEAINDAGQVVGMSLPDYGDWHAFITGPDGTGMRNLGTLSPGSWGGGHSEAHDINNMGQVVGSSVASVVNFKEQWHAFITGPDGAGMTDLNSLIELPEGVILTDARGINDNGQVIAIGVPEPETYALMLAGLGLIGFMARRKKAV